MTQERGSGDAPAPPVRPAPLPCLNNPNSVHPLCPEADSTLFDPRIRVDAEGRHLWTVADGDQVWIGGMSAREKKNAFALVENLAALADLHGIEKLGFLTLTFKENLRDFREAQRRFNSLSKNVLRPLFSHWVVVVEPQRRGAVHYHLVVVCKEDIRIGFDFGAVAAGNYKSASPYLRSVWKRLREGMPGHGFGRSELLPVKSNAEGISKYVGKYLEKGSMFRGDQFKGARMVRYSRGWRRVGTEFAWVSPNATKWRRFVDKVATLLGCADMQQMNDKFGRYWAFKILTLVKLTEGQVTAAQAAQILEQSKT